MRVLAYPADHWGCGYHRVIWPVQYLAEAGHDVQVVSRGDQDLQMQLRGSELVSVNVPTDVDVVVFQRLMDARLLQVVRWLRRRGVTVVMDVDDDLSAIDPRNPAYRLLHPPLRAAAEVDQAIAAGRLDGRLRQTAIAQRQRRNQISWQHTTEIARECSLVTVSTPGLLQRYVPRAGRGVVVRNYLPDSYFGGDHLDSDWVVWPAALHSHPGDPAALGNALRRLLQDGGRFAGLGGVEDERSLLARAFGLVPDQVRVLPASSVADWPALLAQVGVGIVPLADTLFNRRKCLDAGTMITTRQGIMPLRNLQEGNEVWHDDSWHKVTALQAELARPGYEITTRRGHRVRVTPEHRLRSDQVWHTAKQLRVGQHLDLEPESIGQEVYQTRPWPADSRRTRATDKYDPRSFWTQTHGPQVTIEETWGRLLGLFTGDGCVGTKGRLGFSFDTRDQDLIELVQRDLCSVGLEAQQLVTRHGGSSVWVSSTVAMRFLELMGAVEPASERRLRRTYRVPEVIWQSPRSVVTAFLAGLFEADAGGSAQAIFCSKSEQLARDVQRLLTAVGIISTLRRRESHLSYAPKTVSRDYVSWTVTILAREMDRFAVEVGWLSARKRARLATQQERRAAPGQHGRGKVERWADEIVSIEQVWVEPIDLQVDGEVFSAAGVVSHNSWLKGLELAACGVPFVASATPEYRQLAELGAGLLASSPKQWHRLLTQLTGSPELRAEVAGRGREAAERLRLRDHAEEWWRAWELARARDQDRVPATT